ncbi:hypothetical protein AAG906_026366 [Vitis piasezkii]
MWGSEDFRMLLERPSGEYCIYCVCGFIQFEMAGRTRRGRSERDDELERELRETTQLMRGQGSKRFRSTQGQEVQITHIGGAALRV